jgi:carbon storage regulator
MLVLTRKPRQRIVIDGQIVVTVLECGNGLVRLGVEAPREVHVVRAELVSEFHLEREPPGGRPPLKG